MFWRLHHHWPGSYICGMRTTEDSYRHKGLRKKLMETVAQKGITDEKILAAINKIPRHFFLDSAFDEVAYEDKAFPIAEGQTISQPYTVAYQTQLLEVKPFLKVLEIGTGSAYQACVLAELGARVYTIERQKKLYEQNKSFAFLKKYPAIKFFYGDGYEGLPTYAPFDRVLILSIFFKLLRKNNDVQGKLKGHCNDNITTRHIQIYGNMIKCFQSSKSIFVRNLPSFAHLHIRTFAH